jgi:hypothetical protein
MAISITATLNDDGSVTINPSPEYFDADYEVAVGFLTEIQIELDDTINLLEYTNLLV